jgi:NADH:ubiquinone oxidoreductase subunit E
VTSPKENLFLCMGSACHQLGVYDVLPKLQALIQTHGLTDQVELKGSFCLETCSHGIVMKFHDTCFTNISPQNVEVIFESQILPAIQGVRSPV